MSATPAGRTARAALPAQITGGIVVWAFGLGTVVLAGAMLVVLVYAGWRNVAPLLTASSADAWDVPQVLFAWNARSSIEVIGIALPCAAIIAFFAAVAASEPAIGAGAGRFVNLGLRVGPAVPSVCVAVAGITAFFLYYHTFRRLPDVVIVAGLALAALNLPIATARFRTVFRSVPRAWRVAAMAAGATPPGAFLRVVLPRAWPGALAAVLTTTGHMVGETALLAILFTLGGGARPVPADLWLRLNNSFVAANARFAPAEALLILLVVVAAHAAAHVLRGRRTNGAPA